MDDKVISFEKIKDIAFQGWATKQGEKVKNWKRRYFVLSKRKLWYFEKNQSGVRSKGYIDLSGGGDVSEMEEFKKKKFAFSITARGPNGIRIFYLYSDSQEERTAFVSAVKSGLCKEIEEHSVTLGSRNSERFFVTTPDKYKAIGKSISFLVQKPKQMDFFKFWVDSLPDDNNQLKFSIELSSAEEIVCKAHGEQSDFLSNAVEFFHVVGSPETEIERLNSVSKALAPTVLGTWINLSNQGGMDSGWFLSGSYAAPACMAAADKGASADELADWIQANQIPLCSYVHRDTGVAPPRKTEFHFPVPGESSQEKVDIVLSALIQMEFNEFDNPNLRNVLYTVAKASEDIRLMISTTTDGFSKGGVYLSLSNTNAVSQVAKALNLRHDSKTQKSIEAEVGQMPLRALQVVYLKKEYDYDGVYKSGFNLYTLYDVLN